MARVSLEQTKRQAYFRNLDYYLVVPVIVIVLIGLFVLSRVLSDGFHDAYPLNLYRQIGATLAGVLLMLLLSLVETPTMRLVAWLIYGVSVVLLVVVLVDNFSLYEETGSDSWLNLPLIGSFQPSELTKIGLAMTSAYTLEWLSQSKRYWRGFFYLAALYAVPLALIAKQPDFGTAMVIIFVFCCILFVWGIRWRYVFLGLSSFLIMIPVAWIFYFKEYQKNRILTFLYPGHDPAAVYNLMQARAAIASGGLTGSVHSTPVHVPVKESDFIYTAVSEHMGLIGTTALLCLIFFFLTRGLFVAAQISKRRPACALTIVGIVAAMAFHSIENMGMCVGLLPITGIPLPFVSLGGTAMLVNFIALGIMLSISMDRNFSGL